MNGITDLPVSASLFDSKKPIDFKLDNNNLVLTLPDECPNPHYATIDLHFRQPPTQIVRYQLRNNKIRLTPFQAVTHHILKNYIPYTLYGWFSKISEIEFNVYLEEGDYSLEAEYACWLEGGELYFNIDGKNYTVSYENTGNPAIDNDIHNYITSELIKKINIPVSKKYSIKIRRNAEIPNVTNWINVRNFTFKKTSENSIPNTDILCYPTYVKDGYLICESPSVQIIKIYDVMGRLRKTDIIGLYTKVDLSIFEHGVYIIQCGKFSQKIII